MTEPDRAAQDATPVEIACDESGFTGGNLTFRHTVFAHASILVSHEAAAEEMARLRRRVVARGELKASWLLRWCDHGDLVRLLGATGVTGGRVRVHLTVPRLFLLTRLLDVIADPTVVSGVDLPGAGGAERTAAVCLYRHGDQVFGTQCWQRFLVLAGHALRTNSRWVPATAVSDFEQAVGHLWRVPMPQTVRDAFARLRSAGPELRTIRTALSEDPRRAPLLEPLLPAVSRAVLGWGAEHPVLVVVHDEQSALTPWRVAEMQQQRVRARPGHTFELVRVDSRDDARVQVADLIAGIARRAAAGLLTADGDRGLLHLIAPYVDPASIWPDRTWQEGIWQEGIWQVASGTSERSVDATVWVRDGGGRWSARPA